ncbi:MAG: hypothetical protein ACWA5T_07805 [Parvularcula sp.]
MPTTDLKLEQPGSLPKPGPIGRLVRLAFGILSVSYVVGLWSVRDDLIVDGGSIRQLIWNGIIPALFLISYVVNIGFSRDWKKWPAVVSIVFLLAALGVGYLQTGKIESLSLARAIWVFELYLFAHLGLCFLLSALLATPGCEMRSIHHLFSVLTGRPTAEHHCPVGPLSAIDHWERAQKEAD